MASEEQGKRTLASACTRVAAGGGWVLAQLTETLPLQQQPEEPAPTPGLWGRAFEEMALLPLLELGNGAALAGGRSSSCLASQALASPGSAGSQSSRLLNHSGPAQGEASAPGG